MEHKPYSRKISSGRVQPMPTSPQRVPPGLNIVLHRRRQSDYMSLRSKRNSMRSKTHQSNRQKFFSKQLVIRTENFQRNHVRRRSETSLTKPRSTGFSTGTYRGSIGASDISLQMKKRAATLLQRSQSIECHNRFRRRQFSKELPSIFLAICRRDSKCIEQFLQGSNVHHRLVDPYFCQSALHWAIECGHWAITVQLLQYESIQPTWLSMTDNLSNTPLHVAVCRFRRVVTLLLKHGASVHARNRQQLTPLALLIHELTQDDTSTVETLLQFGADPNISILGESLLHVALDHRLFGIACCLVKYGATLGSKDKYGNFIFDKVNSIVCRNILEHIQAPSSWIPDHERTRCMLCGLQFGRIFRRRHHCRRCGRLCCAYCSSLPPRGKKNTQQYNETKRQCSTCISITVISPLESVTT